MLVSLGIRNMALIEDVTLEPASGLNVLTGETGAGKTIVVEALGLALGMKASSQLVRRGAPRLSVTALFDAPPKGVAGLLAEAGLADGDEVVLRREVEAEGRSRAYVNDRPVAQSFLARIGERLVDFHGQHDHQRLLRGGEQRDRLDDFGGHAALREKVSESYAAWRAVSAEKDAFSLSVQERERRMDLLKFQTEAIDRVAPKLGEDDELERLLPHIRNASKLRGATDEMSGLLGGEDGALSALRKAHKRAEALAALGVDAGALSDLLSEASVRVEEASALVEKMASEADTDPGRADEILSRMDALSKLKRKYGPALADVLALRAEAGAELERLVNADVHGRDIDKRVKAAEMAFHAAASSLTEARASAAKKMAKAVAKELAELGFLKAAFDVTLKPAPPSAAGAEEVVFLFGANPGEPAGPLSAVASGGELSRVMLALKTVLARADDVPVSVFDEIDAGVGGVTGSVVGRKLAELGRSRQILCITHLATIASGAEAHFGIMKTVEKGRTATTVQRLQADARVIELARMLGGAEGKAGTESVRHARALLQGTGS